MAYDQAKAERDKLAAELTEVYPKLVAQLVDLLERLLASDQRVEQVNAALPLDRGPLLLAELVARGLPGLVLNGIDLPRIVRQTRLVAFKYDRHAAYAWPSPASSSTLDVSNLIFHAMAEASARAAEAKAAKAKAAVKA